MPLRETWEAMEELVRRGLVRNIGVCNMQSAMLRDLLSYATIKPAALQVPPLSPPPPLLSLARSASMVLDPSPSRTIQPPPLRAQSLSPSFSLTYTLSHTHTQWQVELHPYLTQDKLHRLCRQHGITLVGFSSLAAASYVGIGMAEAADSLLNAAVIKTIAQKHHRTPAQVVLRWAVQRGTAVIPVTVTPRDIT